MVDRKAGLVTDWVGVVAMPSPYASAIGIASIVSGQIGALDSGTKKRQQTALTRLAL
jgi:hypothetical protein